MRCDEDLPVVYRAHQEEPRSEGGGGLSVRCCGLPGGLRAAPAVEHAARAHAAAAGQQPSHTQAGCRSAWSAPEAGHVRSEMHACLKCLFCSISA